MNRAQPRTPRLSERAVIMTDDHHVACDGGSDALGHPRVWYEMGDDGYVVCKYCDRAYVLRGGPADPGRDQG